MMGRREKKWGGEALSGSFTIQLIYKKKKASRKAGTGNYQ